MSRDSVLPSTNARPRSSWLWLGLVLSMVLVGLYFVGRFQGHWTEADTTTFASAIRAVDREGQLVPATGLIYPNGYAYQAISTFVLALTGLDVASLQQLVYPVLAALVVLPAWALYRELTGSPRGATIATGLLFVQPEFLFVILRSSHEKFTRALLLLSLYWLLRSFKAHDRPRLLTVHVVLFYLTVFALVAINSFMTHSFIVAVALALVLGWLIARRGPHLSGASSVMLRRLPYVLLISLAFSYLFIFYLYPPARHDLLVLEHTSDRIAALFLDVEAESTNAYAYVATGWVSLEVYFLVSIANWIVLVASLAIWARQAVRWLLRPAEATSVTSVWLWWLLYAAFAVQGALSVVADASGALGSNLQHRLFPSFSIVAVGLIGVALSRWRPRRFVWLLQFALAATVFAFGILSVMKASNEPILSNKWTFYHPSELTAIDWSDAHLANAEIWTGLDERLTLAVLTTRGESINQNRFRHGPAEPTTRSLLLSDVTRLRGSRLARPLPVPFDALRVYDNGFAELYRLRPVTPFQR